MSNVENSDDFTDVACSDGMKEYFARLDLEAERCYNLAEIARKKGFDPSLKVEIPRARDLASRVENLLYVKGVEDRIRKFTKEYDRETASIMIATDVAHEERWKTPQEAMDAGVRVGLAVLTEGILVAPLEGVTAVKVIGEGANSYVDIQFSGPIRSAGGTGQAMTVLIADILREKLGIGAYTPTHQEVERYKEEMSLYRGLQNKPSAAELDLILGNCPVCINGEGTEKFEVSGNRDLPRVEGNRVRGGAMLVIAEGMSLKAPKLQKHVHKQKLTSWDFIDEVVELQGGGKKKTEQKLDADGNPIEEKVTALEPKTKYIKDILAGRPVLCHPSRPGGFRLRYGRSRATGLAAVGLSPASMILLNDFIAVGTQMKIERPGKAGAVTPCDTIEGPVVALKNGSVRRINTTKEALDCRPNVETILDVGEMLIPFGEFVENNHLLPPGAFDLDWWRLEYENASGNIAGSELDHPGVEEAFDLSRNNNIPLHPDHNFFWHDLPQRQILLLSRTLEESGSFKEGKLFIRNNSEIKETLEVLGVEHVLDNASGNATDKLSANASDKVTNKAMDKLTANVSDSEFIVVSSDALAFIMSLGLKVDGESLEPRNGFPAEAEINPLNSNEAISRMAGVTIRPKAPTRIGARMARPEKAKERMMKPPPHVLFPLGMYGGMQRLLKEASKQQGVKIEVQMRTCPECKERLTGVLCKCGTETIPDSMVGKHQVNLKKMTDTALKRLGMNTLPKIKGVKGMISATKIPEPIEKGILRAKREVYVFKDGTTRFDLTNVPLTHFKPIEIGLSVQKAHDLGYLNDHLGKPLTDPEQVLELKVQDIILSQNGGVYLQKVSGFIDDMLEGLYGLDRFYNASNPDDLIGQLMVGLAPHTSGGVLSRLIGYTPAFVGYAHPFFHAAKRRNCDGDEDCVMLLVDGLINFSRSFLPAKRGGLMDAPLVLSTRINPDEIDKEAHNIDVLYRYPLEFYRAAAEFSTTSKVEKIMDLVSSRIGTPGQYDGFGYTHDTANIADGPLISKYKTLDSMKKKMDGQLELASMIKAVDATDVVTRMIQNHLLPDIFGTFKKFSTQKVRCTRCNKSFRRIPLSGGCTKPGCEGKLTMAVHQGSVRRYLTMTMDIAKEYEVSNYIQQRLFLISQAVDSLFENDKITKCTIDDFL